MIMTMIKELADELNGEAYSNKDMYSKIEFIKEFNKKYNSLLASVDNWETVGNMEIRQPADAQKDEMLIQQRQSTKGIFPDLWDITAGGQVSAGETSSQSVERELSEELGIDIDMSDMRPRFTMNFSDGFDDVYLIRKKS